MPPDYVVHSIMEEWGPKMEFDRTDRISSAIRPCSAGRRNGTLRPCLSIGKDATLAAYDFTTVLSLIALGMTHLKVKLCVPRY
jgi:hypothetical protein